LPSPRRRRHYRSPDRKGGCVGTELTVLRVICGLWDQTWAKASTSSPLGYLTVTAWSPISANRGRGRGRVPDSGQIGDGDGGASPPPGESGTGTGVSAPWHVLRASLKAAHSGWPQALALVLRLATWKALPAESILRTPLALAPAGECRCQMFPPCPAWCRGPLRLAALRLSPVASS
jgi:hypothetical protein